MAPDAPIAGVKHMTEDLQRRFQENLRMDFRAQNRFNFASGARPTFL
jgi:hypothetical protein